MKIKIMLGIYYPTIRSNFLLIVIDVLYNYLKLNQKIQTTIKVLNEK